MMPSVPPAVPSVLAACTLGWPRECPGPSALLPEGPRGRDWSAGELHWAVTNDGDTLINFQGPVAVLRGALHCTPGSARRRECAEASGAPGAWARPVSRAHRRSMLFGCDLFHLHTQQSVP